MNTRSVYLADRPLDAGRSHYCWCVMNTTRLSLTDETGRPVKSDRKRRKLKSGRSRTFPVHADLLAVLERMPLRDGHIFHGPR